MRIKFDGGRRIKPESARVQTISRRGVIRRVFGCGVSQSVQGSLVDSSCRKRLLILSQTGLGRGYVIAVRIYAIRIVDKPLSKTGQGNNLHYRFSRSGPLPFIAIKEKQLVLYDRASESATESVADQRRAANSGGIAEPVVCLKRRTSVELKCRSVQRICSRLRDEIHLRTRGTALVRVSVRGCDAELFNGFTVEPENGTGCNVAPVGVQRSNH